jgi:hypothetical protein
LKQSQDARIKAEEERLKDEEEKNKTRVIQFQVYGMDILDKCFINNPNNISKFEVASLVCNFEMRSLQGECQTANNTYNFCKDDRFVGYIKQNDILNLTRVP